MRHRIWLSFDLGVRGDYEGMYAFLDAHAATECGDSMATFWFEWQDDLVATLASQLDHALTLDKRSRMYVIYPGPDGRHVGKFVIGHRRSPPWTGYAPSHADEEDVGG